MANRVRQAAQSTYELGYAPREDGEYFGSEYDPEEIARLRAELDDIAKLLFDKEPRVAEKAGMMFLEFDKLFAAYPKSENWELLQKCIPELLKVLGTDNSGPQLWMRIRPPLAFLEVYLPKMPRRGAEYEEELVKLMTQAPNPEVREGVMNKLIILQEDRDYVSEDLDGEPVIENHIEELVGMLTTEGSGDVRSNIVRLISTSGIFLTRYEAVVAKMLTDAPDAKGRSARSAAIGALGSYLETEKKYLAEIADLVTYPDCTEEVVSILRQEHLVQEYSDILAKVIFMIETLSSGLDITNGWWLAFNAFNSQPYDLLLIHIDAYVPTIQRVQDQPEEPAGFHHGVKKKDVREMLIKALNKDDSYDFIAAAFVKRPARTLHALTVASIFFESESLAFRKSDIAQSDRLYTEARQLQRIVAGFVAAGFCGLSWPSFIVKYVLLETSFGRETCNLLLQHDVKVVMSLPAVQQVVQDLWESRMGSEMEESHAPFWMATCGMICPPMPYLILLALVGAAGWLASDPNVMLLILEVPTAAHLAVAGVNAFAAWLVWASTSNGWGKWLYWDTKAIRMACIATFAVLSAWSLVMSTLLNDSTPLLISEVMEWLGAQALSARVLATAGAALPGVIMIFIRHDSYGTEEDLITQWDYALIACWPLAFAFSALALGPVLSPLLAGCVVVQFVLPMLTLASMPHLWEYVYFIGDKTLFDPGTQISEYMRLPYSVTLLAMFLGPIHILRIPVVKSVIGVTLHFVFAFALTTLPLATLPTPALGGMLVWTIGFVVEEVTELMRKPAARIREPLRVLKFAGLLLAFVAQLATLALVTDEDADRGSGSSLLTMASSVADAEDVLLSIAVFMLILVQVSCATCVLPVARFSNVLSPHSSYSYIFLPLCVGCSRARAQPVDRTARSDGAGDVCERSAPVGHRRDFRGGASLLGGAQSRLQGDGCVGDERRTMRRSRHYLRRSAAQLLGGGKDHGWWWQRRAGVVPRAFGPPAGGPELPVALYARRRAAAHQPPHRPLRENL